MNGIRSCPTEKLSIALRDLVSPFSSQILRIWATGPEKGGPEKVRELSRLGELLNTQQNVHFLGPPGNPGILGGYGGGGVPPYTPYIPPQKGVYSPSFW